MAKYINQADVANTDALVKLLESLNAEVTQVRTMLTEVKADFNAHTHAVGGVTSSGISVTLTATTPVQGAISGK